MAKPQVYLALLLAMVLAEPVDAARFNIQDHGATADDDTDDTACILAALEHCEQAGGGQVFVPTGTFLISRQANESPILEVPSHTTLIGEGAASILKFDPRVNQTNFWRMLGASSKDCRHVTICDLHLDGSNTFKAYEPGTTPEQNHGVFFYRPQGVIENVTIRDCLVENFSGDCIGFGPGCRNMTVRNVTVRNFVRQGIQMAGGNGARDYLVTGCQDLEGEVRPGGSTIHVEHARGLQNVIISDNRCRHSILAGGVDGMIIRDNVITGRLIGNNDTHTLIQGNIVRGGDSPGYVVQFGYADGLSIRNNLVTGAHAEAGGIYVWGASRYNPQPSRDVMIAGNIVRLAGRGIFLNGVQDARVEENLIRNDDAGQAVVLQRDERVQVDLKDTDG